MKTVEYFARSIFGVCLFSLMFCSLALAEKTSTYQHSQSWLIDMRSIGGLTPKGIGTFEMRIYPDGSIEWFDPMRAADKGRTLHADSSGKNWFSAQLDKPVLTKLKTAIEKFDVDGLETEKGKMRPSAYDAADTTIVINGSVKRSVNLWELKQPEKFEPAAILQEIRQRF